MVRKVIARQRVNGPSVAEVKHMLRAGKVAEAWALLQDIPDAEPGAAELWYLRSLAAQQRGALDDAQQSITRALRLVDSEPAYFLLQAGRVAAQREAHDEAIPRFEAALEKDASLGLAWTGLGSSLLAAGRADAGLDALLRAVRLGVGSATVYFDIARVMLASGRVDEAEMWAKKALASPGDVSHALLLLGDIHQRKGEPLQALQAYQDARAAAPEDSRAGVAAATLLWEQGRWDDARRTYADVAIRNPHSLRSAFGAALTLPHVYQSQAHLDESRALYENALAELAQRPAKRFAKPARELLQDLRWCNFLLAYQGQNDVQLQSAFGDFTRAVLKESAPEWLSLPSRARPNRSRTRVGFASHFFYDCTVGRYFSPWVLGLDPRAFEIYLYYSNTHVTPNTQELRSKAAQFWHHGGLPVQAVAQRIRDDELDILIYPELGMHPDTFALAQLRLAPVQCAAWGHPTTTGLPTIDVFIGCASMEPEGATAHYREQLFLLPGLGTRYGHPGAPATASRKDLGLPEDRTLYLVPQSLFKIHPDNDELIADVLAADPKGVAVLFANESRTIVDALVRRLKPVFARRGLSTQEHLHFLPPLSHDAYLAVNHVCDVMLDTVHWSGGNTALDALSVGLPIVTLPGPLMRGRQSSAMLLRMGMDRLVARDREHYVHLAVELGTDVALRTDCRRHLCSANSMLFEDSVPVAALNDLLTRLADGSVLTRHDGVGA